MSTLKISNCTTNQELLGCKHTQLYGTSPDEYELIDSIAAFIRKNGSVRKSITILDELTKPAIIQNQTIHEHLPC